MAHEHLAERGDRMDNPYMSLDALRRVFLAGAVTIVTAACLSGCGEPNARATAACSRSVGGTACKACCGMNGSRVSSSIGSCKCY